MDDIFCIFNSKVEALEFFEYLNLQHNNIKFTYELEEKNKIPFLDVLVHAENDIFSTSVYRKSTFTGLLTNFTSFIPTSYKIGLIKTLINRCYEISSSWMLFNTEIEEIKKLLSKDLFPTHLIEKEIKNFLIKKYSKPDEKPESKFNYFKLPYIGDCSKSLNVQLNKLCKNYCKEVKIRLVYAPYKIGSMFSLKDNLPSDLKSNVVYKFQCRRCNASYIGETQRHINVRIKEHLVSDKNSQVNKHLLENSECKSVCDESCFSIIDMASSSFRLKVKEALHIRWQNPILNKQVKLIMVGITV